MLLVLLREHCCILTIYVAFHILSLSVLATIFAVIFIRLANVCLFLSVRSPFDTLPRSAL